MVLWCALNVYCESKMLQGCIDSIRTAAPQAKIVAVDGCYETWARAARRLAAKEIENGHDAVGEALLYYASPASPDDTLEILRKNSVDRIIETDRPWSHEYDKRSQYFVGGEGDWYLVLDADERLQGKVSVSDLSDPAYNIVLYRDQDRHPYAVTRLFQHESGMSYRGAHHALHARGTIWRKEICRTVGGKNYFELNGTPEHQRLIGEPFHIFHLYEDRGRDVMRNAVRGEYYRHLTSQEEGEFRAVHGL